MTFVTFGINHKTAPLALREKFSVTHPSQQTNLLQALVREGHGQEGMILSTCNRTELYCDTTQVQTTLDWIIETQIDQEKTYHTNFYTYQDTAGIRHAMRVACGLDSMMLGEPQILGQMKQAFRLAETTGTIGPRLRPVFQRVFSVSKRIRSCTELGVHPTSVAYAAAQLIREQHGAELANCQVLLIGAGETSQLIAKHLQKIGVAKFSVASRTLDSAQILATTLDGDALTIPEIATQLFKADIVISATACPVPFVTRALVAHAMTIRDQRPLFLLDLSVPRDIETDVATLDKVQLYNVDHLQDLVDNGLNQRQNAAQQAETLIECELADYLHWYRSQSANRYIVDYRTQMNTLAENELNRIKQQWQQEKIDTEQALDELKRRLFQKLCHQPTVGIRQAAAEGQTELLELTHYLFDNEPSVL